VIIITTKKSLLTDANLPMAGNTLRHQFRDDAFWQPRLQTNNEGKVSFPVTFPDDITSWRTIVIAVGPHRQTGFAEGLTKSFKALSGNIALPTFTIAGDVINVIGKTLNYLPDSIQVKRTFSVNGHTTKEGFIGLRNSWIDTFLVSSLKEDSIKMRYTVEKADGYWDGEERSIPVFQPGVMETNGMFAALRKDTSFTLAAFPDTTKVKIYAEASLLPVLYDEAESVRQYEYLCNEQLASKLKALLVQKKVDQYLHRSFPYEKNIREIVRMLGQGKSSSGLWGWWTATDPSMWISLHAIEALLQAQESGYTVSLNKTALTDYLVFNLENYQGVEKISSLFILQQVGAKVDYKKYLDSLEKRPVKWSLYEQLRMEELKQRVGEKVVPDSFLVKQKHTALGNVYWGDDEYHLFNNSIQNTLTMYRLLRGIGGYSEVLEKIRSYFLEKRKTGHWRNTYESSLILETILPDLLAENDQNEKPILLIKSDASVIVQDFPFATEVRGGQPLTISKQGKLPVYFTAYQQYWNKNPDKLSGNFAVHSTFEHNQQPVSVLKGGNPVNFKVHVSVKADADFVLVEIPIPAGCSYADKKQPRTNNEVHREYFKNKVSIFCKSLEKGEYSFEVALLPRYNGVYALNPAKAEMMYFPVFNGREAIRKVEIR
jgi:alpha-2-macroglobulin